MKPLLLLLSLVVFGCTVYKSSDRDSFNQNALASAPVSLTKAVGASECWLTQDLASRIEVRSDFIWVQEENLLCSFTSEMYSPESRDRVKELATRLHDNRLD
jgi:hypothetical protein